MVFFTYTLFFFSSFSIAGVEASVGMLYLLALGVVWHSRPQRSLPWWVWAPFLGLMGMGVVSVLANGGEGLWWAVKSEYRIFLPFALLIPLRVMDLRRLLAVMLVPALLMAVYGLIQFKWGVDWLRVEHKILPAVFLSVFRAQGNFTTSLTYAGVMLMAVPVFGMAALEERGRWRGWFAAGAVLAFLAVVASLSRSGWLGLGAALLVLALRLPRRWSIPLAGGSVALILGLGVVLWSGGLKPSGKGSPLTNRIEDAGQGDFRLVLWRGGWMSVKDNPWLGVGLKNDQAFIPYREAVTGKPYDPEDHPPLAAGVHNIYLQMWVYSGLAGLVIYLALWGGVLFWAGGGIRTTKGQPDLERGLLWGGAAALVGSMVMGFFENNFFDGEVQAMIMICMGLTIFSGLRVKQGQGTGRRRTVR
ncbi:MAG: O-antigen ligase family protein [Deltaproteobacteria bacterium]|nr:O-antigen ligase family protein [Deltaproteobacteria bacterium]